jgi:hypothetical protein
MNPKTTINSRVIKISSLLMMILYGFIMYSQNYDSELIINEYSGIKEILSISPVSISSNAGDYNSVVVKNPDIFRERDTVLFIMVKGAEIYSPYSFKNIPATFWGNVYDLNSTGIYALLFIKHIAGDTITFSTPLQEIDPPKEGDMSQLVKIKTFDILEIDQQINCKPWDPVTGTGGILVLFAKYKIILNANIDASGCGFRGARPFHFDPLTTEATDIVTPSVLTSKCSAFTEAFYPDSQKFISGYKGESFVSSNFKYIKGFNHIATGGGGGNGVFSGGGGGSNAAFGGYGGMEYEYCNPEINYGGKPGTSIDIYYTNTGKLKNRLFMGGGGGSGTKVSVVHSTVGGNGGGIIIMITDSLISMKNDTIRANGQNVTDIATGSGGGGGGAGCIVLDVAYYKGNLHCEARGGNGGNTNDSLYKTGPGGFGSGGVIWHSGNKLPEHFTYDLTNGKSGHHLPTNSAWGATTSELTEGIIVKKLVSPLKGFLFNFLGNEQIRCDNDTTIPLMATTPKGGDGVYKVEWQISYDYKKWGNAPGKYKKEQYYAGSDIQKAFFRRIISSADVTDTSNVLEFHRYLPPENNLIEGDQSVCEGSHPSTLIQKPPGLSGAANELLYIWESKTKEQDQWEIVLLSSDSPDYSPLPLFETSYFRRIVQSGPCYYPGNVVTVNIKNPPKILMQPAGDTITTGEKFRFTVSATGAQPLSYQWMKDNSALHRFTDTTLIIPEAEPENSGQYFCMVSNECGSCSSDTAVLYVLNNTFMNQKFSNSGLVAIFPNPAVHYITLEHQFAGSFEVRIFDLLGNLVLKEMNKKQISLDHLSPGTYILNFLSPSNSFHQNFKLYINK